MFDDTTLLAFLELNCFRAGELHRHTDQWGKLFQYSTNNFSEVQDWIHHPVSVEKFFTHLKRSYKGFNYDCDRPRARIFTNHLSCKPFAQFISDTLSKRLASGNISLWGKVGESPSPHLVMPLTVEPSKPRLCNDNGFLNLWIQDRPFSLDSVQRLPKYVQGNFFPTVYDEKSRYDYIQLSFDSRTFFDLQWGGWFFAGCLVGNRPPISATPPALLPRTIYIPSASPHPYTLTTVIAVSSLSQTTAFQLLIKICP